MSRVEIKPVLSNRIENNALSINSIKVRLLIKVARS